MLELFRKNTLSNDYDQAMKNIKNISMGTSS